MADKSTSTATEIREQEYQQAFRSLLFGIGILLASFLVYFVLRLVLKGTDRTYAAYCLGFGALIGAAIMFDPIIRMVKMKKMPTILYACPYCETQNEMLEEPHSDFDCTYCKRPVYFENGLALEVEVVSCPGCSKDHRISTKTTRFTCDRCNTPMQQAVASHQSMRNPMPAQAIVQAPVKTAGAAMLGGANQSVYLISYAPARAGEVAELMKRETGLSLEDSTRLIQNVSPKEPLIVAYDIPIMEAEALCSELQKMGALVSTHNIEHTS